MDALSDFFSRMGDLDQLIRWGGLAVLAGIIFAETGLLIGFFLPGDSLLFSAGTLVGTGLLKAPSPLPQDPLTAILALCFVLCVAAVAGDWCGFAFGRRVGRRLFERPDSRLFKREHLVRTEAFYEKHGTKTIILARWVPFARTFAPIVAGVAEMPFRTFMTYNAIGGVTWVLSMTWLGYLLGNVPFVKQHNEKIIILIVVLSVLPAAFHALRERRQAA